MGEDTDPTPEATGEVEVVRAEEAAARIKDLVSDLLAEGISEDDVAAALDHVLTEIVGEGDEEDGDNQDEVAPGAATAAAATDPGFVRASELGHNTSKDES